MTAARIYAPASAKIRHSLSHVPLRRRSASGFSRVLFRFREIRVPANPLLPFFLSLSLSFCALSFSNPPSGDASASGPRQAFLARSREGRKDEIRAPSVFARGASRSDARNSFPRSLSPSPSFSLSLSPVRLVIRKELVAGCADFRERSGARDSRGSPEG